jgi:hypothetical protein
MKYNLSHVATFWRQISQPLDAVKSRMSFLLVTSCFIQVFNLPVVCFIVSACHRLKLTGREIESHQEPILRP